MSTPKKSKANPKIEKQTAPSIVWFEIAADNLQRARKFYGKLFGWKSTVPRAMEYWHIDTGGGDDTPTAEMMQRQHPQHGITTTSPSPP